MEDSDRTLGSNRTFGTPDDAPTLIPAEEAPTLPPGTMLAGRYQIVNLLGVGGMGAVYKAFDRQLTRLVALKTILPEMAGTPTALKRFKQEVLLAQSIVHKNVVRIFDIGEDGGTKFITMDFIVGADLKSLITQKGKLPPAEAAGIIRQVCQGLEAAHAAGVVHRDLKPQNIMIEKDGHIVVMDFGIARSGETRGATQTGAFLGTPEYMSPEQAQTENVDARSDIFSIGLIFYELLTGKLPFQGKTVLETMFKRTTERAIPPAEIDATVPKGANDIVNKCLQMEREKRYQSVTELLEDLEMFDPTKKVGAAERARARLRRVRYRNWAAVTVAVALLAGGYGIVRTLRNSFSPATQGQANQGPVVSMAILPFRNASGDPSFDALGPTLAELLRNNVGQSSYLRTVSLVRIQQILADLRFSPQSPLDTNTLRKIAEFSSTDTLISGQYSKVGEHIRLDVTYQDFKKQRTVPLNVEADSENNLLKKIEELADAIQREVTSSPDVLKELRAKTFKPSSTSLVALRYYNEGLDLTRQGNNTEALKRFELSTKEDPNFALALSRLARAYSALGQDNEAEQFSRKAMALAEKLPDQEKYLIAAIHARVRHDNDKAIESYENLVKVFPNDSDVHAALAGLYEDTGRYDKSRDEYNKVLGLDPKDLEALAALGQLEIQGRNGEGALQYLNNALTLSIQLNNQEAKGKILNLIGRAYKELNRYEEALRSYKDALATRQKLGQKNGVAQTLTDMGFTEYLMGDADAASKHFAESLRLYREVGNKRGLGNALTTVGIFYLNRAQYDEALKSLKECLQIQRELQNSNAEARCLNNIGNVYLIKGQLDDALQYYRQTLTIKETLNIPKDVANAYHNLGETATALGDYDQALNYFLKAIDLRRKVGDKRGEALASYGMGVIYEDQGRYGAALSSKEAALKAFQDLQERSADMATILSGYGSVLSEIGRWDEAVKKLDEALAVARNSKTNWAIVDVLIVQGNSFFYRGDFKSARTRYEEALKLAIENHAESRVLFAKIDLARLTVKEGRAQSAVATLRQLRSEADTLGFKRLSVACSVYLGEALLKTNDYKQARAELESALPKAERLGLQSLQAEIRALLGSKVGRPGNNTDAATQ